MSRLKAPCHNCTDRTAECHASCKAYKEYAEAQREYIKNSHEHLRTFSSRYGKVQWTPSDHKRWRDQRWG